MDLPRLFSVPHQSCPPYPTGICYGGSFFETVGPADRQMRPQTGYTARHGVVLALVPATLSSPLLPSAAGVLLAAGDAYLDLAQ